MVLRNAPISTVSDALVRRALLSDERRGKWLIASTARLELVFHFGMAGRLEWLGPHEELGRFVRFRVSFSDGSLVYRDPRRLSGIWVCANDEEVADVTGPLGPDVLGISFRELDDRLEAHRGAFKAQLMDQRVVAGIGNMLADEILWRARVHPRASYADLSTSCRRAVHRSLTVGT